MRVNQDTPTSAVKTKKVQLCGTHSGGLVELIRKYPNLDIVDEGADVVLCYGGDGTLLDAELRWPGVPKVPILNSTRGHRCIPHPPEEVIGKLAQDGLVSNPYTKIQAQVRRRNGGGPLAPLVALNEFNVHMDRINSAVRFKLWLNGDAYDEGVEVLGDGFVLCTPFGSTAYFNQITRGIFTCGIGIAFKSTHEHTNHLVIPDDVVIRVRITRGPAVLAHDSSTEYLHLEEGDEMVVKKHHPSALILTCGPLKRLDEPF